MAEIAPIGVSVTQVAAAIVALLACDFGASVANGVGQDEPTTAPVPTDQTDKSCNFDTLAVTRYVYDSVILDRRLWKDHAEPFPQPHQRRNE